MASCTPTAGLAHLVRSTSDESLIRPNMEGHNLLKEPAKLQTQGSSTTVEVKLPALSN